MSEENKVKRTDDELLLKSIVIDTLKPWMDEKPEARTQSIVASKCPNVSSAKLSRILTPDNPACPTLEESIELLACSDKLVALDRFSKNSTSATGAYIRALKNWKGEQVSITLPDNADTQKLLAAINDGISGTKGELRKNEKYLFFASGVMFGAILSFFAYLNYLAILRQP
jgi:hypothetical protein